MSDKQQDDALTDAYRRASASEADRPSAATRAAILAAAAAAARRNAPAANESRYWPRAVASIAVVGIGVLLWRQTGDQVRVDAPVVTSAAVVTTAPEVVSEPVVVSAPVAQAPEGATQTESLAKAARAVVPERIPEPARAAGGAGTAGSTSADVVRELPAPQPFPAPERERAPAPAPPAPVPVLAGGMIAPTGAAAPPAPPMPTPSLRDEEPRELMITGTKIQAPKGEGSVVAAERAQQPQVGGGVPPGGAAPGGAAPGGGGRGAGGAGAGGGARAAGGAPPAGGARFGGGARGGGAAPGGAAAAARPQDSTALLRQYFPAQYQSDTPHSVWLVLNAAGEAVQSGELAPGQVLADLASQIALALGDRVPGPWQVQSLLNARGQQIELAIARMP